MENNIEKQKTKKVKDKVKCKGYRFEGIVACTYNASKDSNYCGKHKYFEKLEPFTIDTIDACHHCKSFHKKDIPCKEANKERHELDLQYREKTKNEKEQQIKCMWYDRNWNKCRNLPVNDTEYCEYHKYVVNYTQDMKDKSIRCSTCIMIKYCGIYKICSEDIKRAEENRRDAKDNKILCLYCNKFGAHENGYCGKHQIVAWKLNIEKDGTQRVCSGWKRGCRNILEFDDKFKNCEECREINLENVDIIEYFKKSAHQRNIHYKINDSDLLKLINCFCTYCGGMNERGWNGLDRINNNGIYELNNVTPACKYCNMIKGPHNMIDIPNYITNILENYGCNEIFENDNRNKISYDSYKLKTTKRTKYIKFLLTENEYNIILTKKCIYCASKNRDDQIGVDRIDSNGHYTKDNSVPACGICNLMKSTYTSVFFLNHIKSIIKYIQLNEIKLDHKYFIRKTKLIIKGMEKINKCEGYSYKKEKCINYCINNTKFCKIHKYLEEFENYDINKLKPCYKCNKLHNDNTIKCQSCIDKELDDPNKIELIITDAKKCNGFDYNGKQCNKRDITNKYCKTHKYMAEYSEYELANIEYCSGCRKWQYLGEYKSCASCRKKQQEYKQKMLL